MSKNLTLSTLSITDRIKQDSNPNEGLPNGSNSQNINPNNGMQSPTALLQQSSGSPTSGTPLMARFGINGQSPSNARFQALNTKPVTPNAALTNTTNNITTTNPLQTQQPTLQQQTSATGLANNATIANNPLSQAQLSSIPNLLTSSIPNSLYGAMPTLFGTPQLFAMSPAPASTTTIGANVSRTPQPVVNGNNNNGGNTPNNRGGNKLDTSSLTGSIPNIQQQLNQNPNGAQYLFTAIPNLGSTPLTVTSPAQQQAIFNLSGTPNSMVGVGGNNDQQATIQQSGWGLANLNQGNVAQNVGVNGVNVIQTQNATQFVNPTLYPRTQ